MMKKRLAHQKQISRTRFRFVFGMVGLAVSILMLRAYHLQVVKADYYQRLSEKNRLRKIWIPSERGEIFDRQGKKILGNRAFYDLVLIPQYAKDVESVLERLSQILFIPVDELTRNYQKGLGQASFVPIVLKKNLSLHEVIIVEQNRFLLNGIEVITVPRRDYDYLLSKNQAVYTSFFPSVDRENGSGLNPSLYYQAPSQAPSHVLGYLGEINRRELNSLNKKVDDLPFDHDRYASGDQVGKHGLEKRWEPYLRGQDGIELVQVNAFGRRTQTKSSYEAKFDRVLREKRRGYHLELTLDIELQRVAERAFKTKQGAVVVLEPATGKVLALVSSPSFDPRIYQRKISQEEWQALVHDPFKPLFDKTTGGEYIPGSIYKSVVALAALEEKIVTPQKKIRCPGHFTLGNNTFACWERDGHGEVDLYDAIALSCDVYFYHLGVALGVDQMARYAMDLGLGRKLGLNLNFEKPGLIPTSSWFVEKFKKRWNHGNNPNIAIGQGSNLLTPLQMASLYAAIGNNGTVFQPFLVEAVTDEYGNLIEQNQPKIIHQSQLISAKSFAIVAEGLRQVIARKRGTGRNASLLNIEVAGKTGSAQVVSLRRNEKNVDDQVSLRWKEHAIFTAYAPIENPKIAIAVVSENDAIGGGGAQAAPIAKKIFEAFFRIEDRQSISSRL